MKKILLAYDGTASARRALETTVELSKALAASVSVVSVVPARRGPVPLDPWDDGQVHRDELAEANALLRQQGIDPELIEPVGDPARKIEQVADEGGFDFVVVGSRGLGIVGRALEGSVSEHVATHTRRTVVVAR